MRSTRRAVIGAILGASVAIVVNTPAWSQNGTQRQTKLVLPKIEAPDAKPEFLVHRQSGHRGVVGGFRFSADGRSVATWSGGELLLWSIAARGSVECTILDAWGAGGEGTAALSWDGSRVATAAHDPCRGGPARDRSVRVWSTRGDARLAWTVSLGRDDDRAALGARSPTWSPDGTMLAAVVGLDHYLQPAVRDARPQFPLRLLVWDAATGAQLTAVDLPTDDSAPDDAVVAFRADGGLAIALKELPSPEEITGSHAQWVDQAPMRLVARGEWLPGFRLELLAYRGSRPEASAGGRWWTFTWQGHDEATWLGVWDATTHAAHFVAPLDPQLIGELGGSGTSAFSSLSGSRVLLARTLDPRLGPLQTGTHVVVDLTTGRWATLAGPAALSSDGALAASSDRVVDTASGLPLFSVVLRAPAGARFEAGGRQLVWCDASGEPVWSWPLGGAEVAATPGLEWRIERYSPPSYLSLIRGDGARTVCGSPVTEGARMVAADVSPDGLRLAVSDDGGAVYLWDLAPRGQAWAVPAVRAAFFFHDLVTGAGAAVVPQGFVWSSPGAEAYLAWRLGDQVYPYGQFAERYERPDLVRKALAGEDISGEKGLTGEMIPPTAAFLAPEYDAKVAGKSVKVEIEVAGVRPLKKVDLLMDGRPVSDDIVATAKEQTIEPNHVVISLDLPMPTYARRVRLQAYAYDEEMLRSKAAEVTFMREGAPPPATVLQVLSIGVTRYRTEAWNNLKYADADAASFASLAGVGAQAWLLVNEKATAYAARSWLKGMADVVMEDDVVAIFLAGHGILDANGDYYFLLHDSDEEDLANTALKWDDFVSALKALRAKLVMVFADTCHSGSLTGSESVNTLINRLNKKAGVVVFTASRGDEASIEREDWGHGAFTKALLEGFAGRADTYPKDKLVSLAELKEYVIPRVEELTGGRQHPFLPRVEDFDPAQPIAAVNAEVK